MPDSSSTTTIGVSIAVPEPHGERLRRARAGFGDPLGRHVPAHVTLLPPTQVAPAALDAVVRRLREVAGRERPFRMRLAGTGTFRPVTRVVYVRVVEGQRRCARLQELIRTGPLARDLAYPYHPHVTVAHDLDEEALDTAQHALAGFAARFRITGFGLHRQEPDGTWRRLHSFDLAGVPAGS